MQYKSSEVEARRISIFISDHTVSCGEIRSAIGGQWVYTMVPTSLGEIIKVKCNVCQQEMDCTEYEAW